MSYKKITFVILLLQLASVQVMGQKLTKLITVKDAEGNLLISEIFNVIQAVSLNMQLERVDKALDKLIQNETLALSDQLGSLYFVGVYRRTYEVEEVSISEPLSLGTGINPDDVLFRYYNLDPKIVAIFPHGPFPPHDKGLSWEQDLNETRLLWKTKDGVKRISAPAYYTKVKIRLELEEIEREQKEIRYKELLIKSKKEEIRKLRDLINKNWEASIELIEFLGNEPAPYDPSKIYGSGLYGDRQPTPKSIAAPANQLPSDRVYFDPSTTRTDLPNSEDLKQKSVDLNTGKDTSSAGNDNLPEKYHEINDIDKTSDKTPPARKPVIINKNSEPILNWSAQGNLIIR